MRQLQFYCYLTPYSVNKTWIPYTKVFLHVLKRPNSFPVSSLSFRNLQSKALNIHKFLFSAPHDKWGAKDYELVRFILKTAQWNNKNWTSFVWHSLLCMVYLDQ